MFKKITFEYMTGWSIERRQGKDVTNDEAIEILKDPRLVKFTAERMTQKEAFKFMKEAKEVTPDA